MGRKDIYGGHFVWYKEGYFPWNVSIKASDVQD